jgi:hypothetical protein
MDDKLDRLDTLLDEWVACIRDGLDVPPSIVNE